MAMNEVASLPYLKVSTEPVLVRIASEPRIVLTARGYAPVVEILECRTKEARLFFIAAKSLADRLEAMRRENGGAFVGLEFWVRKASEDRMAQYVVEAP
jgi:hypothetical protein